MNYSDTVLDTINFLEDNLTKEVNLGDLDKVANLSQYHLSRIFHAYTGYAIGSYLRERRLSEASKILINSNARILDVALDFQFNSQEAFTRSFKSQFYLTPARYRLNKKNLVLLMKKRLGMEAINFYVNNKTNMEYKIVEKGEIKLVGMVTKTTMKDNKIPALWGKFNARVNEINNGSQDGASYGVCLYNPNFSQTEMTDESEYEYLAAISVKDFTDVPADMMTRVIAPHKYALFTHKGDLKNLQLTYDYIYGSFLSKSGYKVDHKDDFELYDSRFNSKGGENSEMDIYVPIC